MSGAHGVPRSGAPGAVVTLRLGDTADAEGIAQRVLNPAGKPCLSHAAFFRLVLTVAARLAEAGELSRWLIPPPDSVAPPPRPAARS